MHFTTSARLADNVFGWDNRGTGSLQYRPIRPNTYPGSACQDLKESELLKGARGRHKSKRQIECSMKQSAAEFYHFVLGKFSLAQPCSSPQPCTASLIDIGFLHTY